MMLTNKTKTALLLMAITATFSVRAENTTSSPPPSSPTTAPATTNAATPTTRPAFTLGYNTTRIVAPLLPDGRPDYVTALDQAMSKGVTPENNVIVGLLEVLGTGETMVPSTIHDEALKRLGIKEEHPATYKSFKDYLKTQDKENSDELDRQINLVCNEPWDPDDYPVISDWLTQNDAALDQIVKATTREHYYWPMIATTDDTAMIHLKSSPLPTIKDAVNTLRIRAMLRLYQGKIEESQSDLLAIHRLGRLLTQAPMLIECLVGIAIEAGAAKGDTLLADFLTPLQAKAYLIELTQLQSMGSIAQVIDVGERYMALDSVLSFTHHGLEKKSDDLGLNRNQAKAVEVFISKVSWDEILIKTNTWYDRLVSTINKPTFAEHRAATIALDKGAENFLNDKWAANEPTEKIGKSLLSILLPSLGRARQMADRAQEEGDLGKLAIALAAYHGEKGTYPDTLDALSPAYFKQIPIDIFSDKPLKYHKQDNGYILYSVGPNQKDDGGKGITDYNKGDIIVAKTK